MHVSQREKLILDLLAKKEFVTFRELEANLSGSPATIRRDLERLARANKLERVRGGAKSVQRNGEAPQLAELKIDGTSFEENVKLHQAQKEAIGRAAALLCSHGEAITIDGGSTTLQMCRHLDGLKLQVMTNSLYIVSILSQQTGTRLVVPGGAVFPEQNIILPLFGEELLPNFYAPKLFMGAGALGPQGLMQEDVVLVASERRFVERAEEVVVLADASKFENPSGNVVCSLDDITTIITDDRISDELAQSFERSGVNLVVVSSC